MLLLYDWRCRSTPPVVKKQTETFTIFRGGKGRSVIKSVTLKDVAKAAGVSYATVSRALSGSPQIGSDTRERIIKLCDEMGYTTNYVARSMVMKKTDLIGLVVPSVDNQFMSEMADRKSVV